MSKLQEPFRYDYVGSFLRTEELKKATTQYNENKITKEVYDNIVNEEIAKLVEKQKELGYHVITDGEFRRTYWHLDFMWGFERNTIIIDTDSKAEKETDHNLR